MTRYLAAPEMLANIRQRVIRPLKDLKLVCYYGCQMVRPPKITGYTDYENPQTLDRLAQTVGAEVIDWSYKATCCGASIGIARKDIQSALTERILMKALQTGAEAVVVSCPLCQSNLDMFQQQHPELALPVFYFTELLRVAFAGDTRARWFKKHFVDPVPLLARKGLIE
jgi:heterodisulfide reductase subunit B